MWSLLRYPVCLFLAGISDLSGLLRLEDQLAYVAPHLCMQCPDGQQSVNIWCNGVCHCLSILKPQDVARCLLIPTLKVRAGPSAFFLDPRGSRSPSHRENENNFILKISPKEGLLSPPLPAPYFPSSFGFISGEKQCLLPKNKCCSQQWEAVLGHCERQHCRREAVPGPRTEDSSQPG